MYNIEQVFSPTVRGKDHSKELAAKAMQPDNLGQLKRYEGYYQDENTMQ